jgi:hypothetical protein
MVDESITPDMQADKPDTPVLPPFGSAEHLAILERRGNLTVPEFCEMENISHGYFYKLKTKGLAPRMMTGLDSIVRISREARAEWRARMEQGSGSSQPSSAEKMRLRKARKAIKASLASGHHVSTRKERKRR